MQLSHTAGRMSALFDEPNLIGSAGLVPAIALTGRIGLAELADRLLTVPGAKDCAGVKVTSVLAGMLAGADSIDDLDLLRHGAMGKLFGGARARPRWVASCGRSSSGTSANSTRSPPVRSRCSPGGCPACCCCPPADRVAGCG